jgi:bifunctional UDP-N-acetylglucosamine pyrophosphorylase/glucosamine-1-phosphate N-acetyltransferase
VNPRIPKTTDLCDACDGAQACALLLQGYGLRRAFTGPIRTLRCHEDIGLMRDTVSQPGLGQVLVIDGGGSVARALFGDVMAAAASRHGWAGLVIHGVIRDADEINGINDRLQLAQCEAVLQQRLREHWMREGVSFIDPGSCTLSEGTRLGRDVVVEPQCHFRGITVVGEGCRIGPGCLLDSATIGDRVEIVHSVVREATVASGCAIGPFAQLRPGTVLESDCRVGNFVEIKNSNIGTGSKVNHLSYIGDADLGTGVNVGAGTITANYDGVRKHRTVIGSGSKTGANSVLVAPITLGEGVTVGAGSTLTKDVPSGSLALGRARQLVRDNWQGPS